MTTRHPTIAGVQVPIADTVCECGHWYDEHDCAMGDDPIADAWCGACDCNTFRFSEAASKPEAIADRGGDPDLWPEHVKRAFTA